MPIRDYDTIGQLVVVDRFSYDASGATNITADDVIGAIDDLDAASGGGGGGSGDVTGPASATDNAVARFNLTTGKVIQNSGVTIDDSGNIATSGTVDGRDLSTDGTKLDGIASGAVADHGALSGIADDDHTQYAKNVVGYLASGFALITGADNREMNPANVQIDVSGNITSVGTVDGRDVAADGAKLDGIASGAVADHGALSGLSDDDHAIYTKNVTSHSASGFITTTGATSRDLAQSPAAVDVGGNFSTTGDISTSGGDILVFGTVDGRDVATDGTKLDTIETNADVTDATNVDAAGAVMESDLGGGSGFQSYAFGTWSTGRTIQGGTGITLTNGNGVSGNPSVAVDGTVLTDSDFVANGLMTRSSAGNYTSRTLTAGTAISVGNGDGVAGNPTVTFNGATTDLSNWGTVGKNEILYYDASNQVQGDSLPGQLIAITFGSNNSSSGNLFLRSSIASSMTSGVGSTIQTGFGWSGSLVGIALSYQVTAWTSGGVDCEVNVEDGGAGYTILHSEQTTATGTGDFKQIFTYSPGTHTFSADSLFGVKFDHNNAGSVLTTDDQTCTLYFLLDANLVTLA